MSAFPTNPTKANVDSGLDDPKQGRTDVANLIDRVIELNNAVQGLLGSDGVAATARSQLGLKALAIRDTVGGNQIDASSIVSSKIAANAVELSDMKHHSQAGVLIYNSSGTPAAINASSTGYVLTANGSSSTPSFKVIPAFDLHTEAFSAINYSDGNSYTMSFGTSFGHRNYVCAIYLICTGASLSYEVGDYIEVTEGFVIARNQASAIVRVASDGFKARKEADHSSEAIMVGLDDSKWNMYFVAMGE